MLTYRLKPTLTPGDLVATFTGTTSRADAFAWLDRAPARVKLNLGILTIATYSLGDGRTSTIIRVGGSL